MSLWLPDSALALGQPNKRRAAQMEYEPMAAGESIHLMMDPELIRILKRECLEQQITVSKFMECLAARWLAARNGELAECETDAETEQRAA
jgi:hypothetical protein